ncbi:MAG: response regulator [Chitinophagaceae bacterium]|nr:response regulator [Chitinophagaceae bacterium]MCW5905122.1 response regulator [Chitinophagaceae bacterium]
MNHQLSNIKVLVAEDNEVNNILIRRMLQHLGIAYDIALTGNEVLQLISNNDYDAVLMDIQMPDKNGIEATIEIRNLPSDTIKNIPVIALTANSLKGEEQKYIAAGMNGYLTKPFKENELEEILVKVVIEKNNLFVTKLHTAQTSSPKLYDLALIADLAQGNEDFIKNLSQIFIDTIPATSKELLHEVENKNWEQAGKIAHKLKSTIDTMRIAEIKEDVRVIEANGKTATNVLMMPILAQKIDRVINTVAMQLKEEFNL